MKACPICSTDVPDDALECTRCHLSTGLFGPVREALEVSPADPQYLIKAREVAAALGQDVTPTEPPGPARLSQAARFLAMPAAGAGGRSRNRGSAPPLVSLPALPAAPDVVALRRRIDEYFQVGRREGLDLTGFHERTRLALETQNREQLEAIDRELFVHVAAALAREYESIWERTQDLEDLLPETALEPELSGARSALAMGDLHGAQRRLALIELSVSDLEEEWATVQILLAEAELLTDTAREMGLDPAPALGPLEEGRRLAKAGRRAEAEPILARSIAALWALLEPRFSADLDRLKEALLKLRESGADVSAPSAELAAVALHLHHRNFASAVSAYRQARDWVERTSAALPPETEKPVLDSPAPAT